MLYSDGGAGGAPKMTTSAACTWSRVAAPRWANTGRGRPASSVTLTTARAMTMHGEIFTSGGYGREEQPIGDNDPRVVGVVGRFNPDRHADNRSYGQVRSFGELQEGARSWADLGVSSTRAGQSGITDEPLTSYRGVGPKGYTRSDERLAEEICERLTDHPRIDASEIDVQVSRGEVTLTGNGAGQDRQMACGGSRNVLPRRYGSSQSTAYRRLTRLSTVIVPHSSSYAGRSSVTRSSILQTRTGVEDDDSVAFANVAAFTQCVQS